MRIRTFLAIAIMVFSHRLAIADTLKSEAELRTFANSVMAEVGSGDLDAAFALMKRYSVIPPTEFDVVTLNTKAQRDQLGGRFGAAVGYEFISESKVGQSLVRLTYIEKTERHALPWMFFFYRSPEGWVLNSFIWHDQFPNLFGV